MAGKTFSKIDYSTNSHEADMTKYNQQRYGNSFRPIGNLDVSGLAKYKDYDILQFQIFKERIGQPSKDPRLIKLHSDQIFNETTDFYDELENNNLTYREGQYNFSTEIIEHLTDEDIKYLVKEAGVGIGKSYAYLLPLFYYIKSYNGHKNIVISTSTIALQEQLIKDIENLKKLTGINLSYKLVKGMNNYYCLDKAKESELDLKSSQDRKDYPELTDKEWESICVDKCQPEKCNYRYNCDYYEIKEAIRDPYNHIVICNHNMLVEYLNRQSPNTLSKADVIVCDEAHNLENVMKDYYTKEIVFNKIFREIKKYTNEKEASKLKKELYKELNIQKSRQIKYLKNDGTNPDELNELKVELNRNLKRLLESIICLLYEAEEKIESILIELDFNRKNNKDLEDLLDKIYEYQTMIRKVLNEEIILWMDTKKDSYKFKYISIKDLNKSNPIGNSKGKIIFTSATLTSNNKYDNFVDSIGLPINKTNTTDVEESPYDFDNNSLLFIPKDIPSPKNKQEYLDKLVEYIYELIKITDGKSLILFTSKNDMNYVYEQIKNKDLENKLLIQRDGSSQEEIKNEFKNDINSVLFSTGSFWEGIDIKGESLSNLIIAKLPFPVVSPYLEYKRNKYRSEGFNKVYLSEMLIKLKQGCGRLIRDEEDKGIITILDSRSYRYLDSIINSINTKNYTDDIDKVNDFVNENVKVLVK